MNMQDHTTSRAGSPLAGVVMIEVALAIVVLAVGILSVFVIYSKGLDRNARAQDDMHAALFADGALDGLRAASRRAAESGNTNGWEMFWEDFQAGTTSILVAAEHVWMFPVTVRGGGSYTHVYTNYPFHSASITNVIDHALRYRVHVDFDYPLVLHTNKVEVTLWVWPGEYGQTNLANARVFYTEYRNPDDI